jgi:hypothetical protein
MAIMLFERPMWRYKARWKAKVFPDLLLFLTPFSITQGLIITQKSRYSTKDCTKSMPKTLWKVLSTQYKDRNRRSQSQLYLVHCPYSSLLFVYQEGMSRIKTIQYKADKSHWFSRCALSSAWCAAKFWLLHYRRWKKISYITLFKLYLHVRSME